MKNKFLSQNLQLLVLPCLTLLISSSQALALFPASNPAPSPINPVDTSNPTTVVGNGTPNSCTEDAFVNALANGGIITFNCGSSPYTLTLTSGKTISKDTVIDGGNLVTLSGGNKVRILSVQSFYNLSTPSLTVQNLTFANGYTTDVPNTTSGSQGGAAIYKLGGTLNVINSRFINNVGPVTGQDVAGGAIYSIGGAPTTIVDSFFKANQASNGGAIGVVGSGLTVVNSKLFGNTATGNDGNPDHGGNGGGIYIDGVNTYFGTVVNLSGVTVTKNKGNAYGGGLFRVAYNGSDKNQATTIDQSSFDSNSIPYNPQDVSFAGGVYLQDTNFYLVSNLSNSVCST